MANHALSFEDSSREPNHSGLWRTVNHTQHASTDPSKLLLCATTPNPDANDSRSFPRLPTSLLTAHPDRKTPLPAPTQDIQIAFSKTGHHHSASSVLASRFGFPHIPQKCRHSSRVLPSECGVYTGPVASPVTIYVLKHDYNGNSKTDLTGFGINLQLQRMREPLVNSPNLQFPENSISHIEKNT